MDVEKKYESLNSGIIIMLKKFFCKILFVLISFNCLQINNTNAFIPYYSSPSKNLLKKNGSELGKNAYQLLYFGQIKEALAVAKLAVTLNPQNEKLWALLAEAQISNNLYDEAIISINKGKLINPLISELYFAESSIYINQKKFKKAKNALTEGLKIQPKNINAHFQFGNIFLLEKNFKKALLKYDRTIAIKENFWQAYNNKGLILYELNKINLASQNFKKALEIENDAEPQLALAVCLQNNNREKSISLAKKALERNPNYVSYKYRKLQLWGDKLQKDTEKLLKLKELQQVVNLANLYKN